MAYNHNFQGQQNRPSRSGTGLGGDSQPNPAPPQYGQGNAARHVPRYVQTSSTPYPGSYSHSSYTAEHLVPGHQTPINPYSTTSHGQYANVPTSSPAGPPTAGNYALANSLSENVPLMSGNTRPPAASHETYQDPRSYQDTRHQSTGYNLNDTSRPNIGRTIPTALPPGTRNDGVPAIPGSNANALPMRAVYNIAGNEKNDKATLDRNYKIQHKDFFKVGRVFSILWHENQGAKGRKGTLISNLTKGMFGEPIFSGIRRMVVVKESYQCAWCLPVTTYGGKGVAKQDVDASKHAIIHMRRTQPIRGPNEPEMTKKPIEVDPDMPDRTLDSMSRLNFSKVYTVEHNVKVLPVGMISPSSMVRFMSYARSEFKLE